jgi:hypothetical protein
MRIYLVEKNSRNLFSIVSKICHLIFSMLYFGVLVYYHWEAMLVSYLSARVITLPFGNIAQLVSKTDFKIAVIAGSYYVDAFKFSTDPVWRGAFNSRIEPYLAEYEEYGTAMIGILKHDTVTAMYDNYFSIR